MFHWIEVGLVFMLLIIALVAAHEFGHYLFARLFKMGVEEFSIGMFGKQPLVTYMRRKYRLKINPGEVAYLEGEGSGISFEGGNLPPIEPPTVIETPTGPELEETTVFTIRPWPLGGFVRIKGMIPDEQGAEVHVAGGFYSKPPWQRLIVLLAGPAFSVLFGMFILASCFMVSGETMPMQTPVIPEVSAIPPAPAFHAGVQKGDRILSIDGERISTFYQVILKIRDSAGQPHKFVLERKGKPFETTITPYLPIQKTPVLDSDLEPTGELKRQGIIGIQRPTVFRRLAFGEALRESVRFPVMTVVNLLGVVKQPSTAKDSIGGPGTMIMATSDAVDEGSDATLRVAALISISLGIMNLLPIFPLDGGQIVVALAEMLRGGRRLSLQVQNLVGVLGIGLVLLIMASALFVDFGRIRDKPVEPQQANTPPPEPKHGTKATPPTKPTLVQPTKPRVL